MKVSCSGKGMQTQYPNDSGNKKIYLIYSVEKLVDNAMAIWVLRTVHTVCLGRYKFT